MARFSYQGVDELMTQLSSIKIDEIAPKMLEAAEPILENNFRARAEQYARNHDLANSIKGGQPKTVSGGHAIYVRPTGTDRKGVRNMEKLIYHEYGTSRQAAQPILAPAVRESEAGVLAKMQEVFDQEVKAT